MKPIPNTKFQSQTRCQAPGDSPSPFALKISLFISISDEMPGPWRLPAHEYWMCIDRNFNLRRDARPLATSGRLQLVDAYHEFQSQTRCQAPGDSERNI